MASAFLVCVGESALRDQIHRETSQPVPAFVVFPCYGRQAGIAMSGAPAPFHHAADRIARTGGTPLAVAEDGKLLGLVHLKDTVKPDIRDRFAALRAMGIKMILSGEGADEMFAGYIGYRFDQLRQKNASTSPARPHRLEAARL